MTLASERSKQCFADCYLSGLAQSAFLIAERLNANLLLIGKSAQKPVFASRSSGYLALKSLQAAGERKKIYRSEVVDFISHRFMRPLS